MKLTIKQVPVKDLVPYANNARVHTAEQVDTNAIGKQALMSGAGGGRVWEKLYIHEPDNTQGGYEKSTI